MTTNRPLNEYEGVCFSFSIFGCEAIHCGDRVVVSVTIADGNMWQFICAANLSINEIKLLIGHRILDMLCRFDKEVKQYVGKL